MWERSAVQLGQAIRSARAGLGHHKGAFPFVLQFPGVERPPQHHVSGREATWGQLGVEPRLCGCDVAIQVLGRLPPGLID
ncbi:hypothetical protein E2562_021466 [Oryza meyeriana var. granulata]|uniref:Uncharacterized protein n=1 Tax=Oryza meyeriana var. granulata TaxID=110450 RepID=A0A6G1DZ37_9ORYZ|nr:hypothetical protein E2562_021466 [Oryza meyeriana var. granulata]